MTNKVKKWVIAIAIALVFNLFTNYGIGTFYPGAEYEEYCSEKLDPFPLKDANDCETITASEQLQEECTEKKGYIDYNYDSSGCPAEAYCETCSAEFNEERRSYDGNVFVALLVVAIIALALGLKLKSDAVSNGLLLAGILGLLIASTSYWTHLQDVYRFLLLGVILAILIWLGYKKVK